MVSVENWLTLMGIAAEAAFLALLVWRRTYRTLPIFFSYIVWGLAGDSAVLLLRTLTHNQNSDVWVVETFIDCLFQYAVLIELAWSILRPVRGLLPKGFLTGLSVLIAAAALAAWPLSTIKNTVGYPWEWLLALHGQRCFAVIRIVFFLVLAGCSQFLRNRMARSGATGCDRSGVLFPGKPCRHHGACTPGLRVALLLRGIGRRDQLPVFTAVLDIQFCAAGDAATRDDTGTGKSSQTDGWDGAPPPRRAKRTGIPS
jgi:hypothetical protein